MMRISGCLLMGAGLMLAITMRVSAEPLVPPKYEGELIFLRDFGTDEVGYLSIPKTAPVAGLVVVHGRHGLDPSVRLLCDRLAAEGVLSLAVDLFNGRVPSNEEEARQCMEGTSPQSLQDAIETGVRFFNLSPRFQMQKVVILSVGENARAAIAVVRKNKRVSGVTFLDPDVIPAQILVREMGIPVQVFISSEKVTSASDSHQNDSDSESSPHLMRIIRMPEVLYDDPKTFRRTINDRIWPEALSFWSGLDIPERSITDRIIRSVF
ncbi:MAG: dienelactone hydrolase family protein [Candidatus Methylacidiphilales bacterium]